MSAAFSRRRRLAAACGAAALLVAAGCSDDGSAAGSPDDGPDEPTTSAAESSQSPTAPPSSAPPQESDLALAESETREDSVYPEYGDPLVDALHYDLDLTWTPDDDLLEATETLRFRATGNAKRFQLDFADTFDIDGLTVDGEPVPFEHDGKDLVVATPVRADHRYVVQLTYAGTPEAWPAPTNRPDFAQGIGWNITTDHSTWTLQEPYGAFTWYAVNDQPADKALYDFSLTVPDPWTGVANGELTATTEEEGQRTTTWHLAEPASSYLVTVAFDDYTATELESTSGVPITIWVPTDEPAAIGEADYAPEAMDWLEELLGPYPFDTFGIVIVDAEFGMETQTMVTLGDTSYSTSAEVIVHEVAHQWYGDTVSPNDWRDVWMNEGMATYLQLMWQAEEYGGSIDDQMDSIAGAEASDRRYAGPPADYDEDLFGNGNIYYGPALMWHELRERIGDEKFFEVARRWPESQENEASGREEYWAWIEKETGEELTAFFEAWLLAPRSPDRD